MNSFIDKNVDHTDLLETIASPLHEKRRRSFCKFMPCLPRLALLFRVDGSFVNKLERKTDMQFKLPMSRRKETRTNKVPNSICMQVTLKRSGPPERRGAGRSRRASLEWRRDVGEAVVRRVGF
ncbi:hypothetical protein F2Q69_00004985 [Brassica cretica]|uniref:Uncharacterized protein n=1 Tax=Brassica cretica TaxID=69181 RepID=A0A8S9P814_BRACR|nr:hypothetical protein F2Q69_00004985 [Brassica cretica]